MCALMIEVFVFESWDCFLTHVLIPYSLFRKQIAEALATVLSVAAELFSEDRDVNVQKEENVLNSPSYLYLSSAVADSYPDLIESAIVKSYHSVFPDKCSSKWAHLVPPSEFDSCYRCFLDIVSRILRGIVYFFHKCSIGGRGMIMHMILPVSIVAIILEFDDPLSEIVVGLSLGVSFVLVVALRLRYLSSRLLRKIRMVMKTSKGKVLPLGLSDGVNIQTFDDCAEYQTSQNREEQILDDYLLGGSSQSNKKSVIMKESALPASSQSDMLPTTDVSTNLIPMGRSNTHKAVHSSKIVPSSDPLPQIPINNGMLSGLDEDSLSTFEELEPSPYVAVLRSLQQKSENQGGRLYMQSTNDMNVQNFSGGIANNSQGSLFMSNSLYSRSFCSIEDGSYQRNGRYAKRVAEQLPSHTPERYNLWSDDEEL